MYQRKPKPSFKHATRSLTPSDIGKAANFWIMEVQKSMYVDIEKGRYPERIQIIYTWLEDGEKDGLR